MDYQFNCQFEEPVNIGDGTTTDFEFSKMVCTTTNPTISYISEGGKSFYLSKTWNYGTLFLAFLIFLIILFKITNGVIEFLLDKVIRIKGRSKHFF